MGDSRERAVAQALGATVLEGRVAFRVWAPFAEARAPSGAHDRSTTLVPIAVA